MAEGDEVAAAAAAADIICSLRGADLGGWTPPWPWESSGHEASVSCQEAAVEEEEVEMVAAWPAVARAKWSRSRHRSPSGSAAKGRWVRGSPASPLDYSGGSGSGSGASTSGGEDGAFCSPPAPVVTQRSTAAVVTHPATPPSTKVAVAAVSSAGSGRRPPPSTTTTTILPVRPRPGAGGQRSRKKMRLPEVQQLVQSLKVENVGLREEMESLQRACTALCKENGKLQARLEHSSGKRPTKLRQELGKAKKKIDRGGFVLPDLNIPAAEDIAVDGSAPLVIDGLSRRRRRTLT